MKALLGRFLDSKLLWPLVFLFEMLKMFETQLGDDANCGMCTVNKLLVEHYLRTLADEGFSMLSKNLPDLAQALETSLLILY
jgi:hypothetical protein